MKNQIPTALVAMLVWSVSLVGQTPNTLTAQEKAQGWQLLFDGKTLEGWKPAGYVGELKAEPGHRLATTVFRHLWPEREPALRAFLTARPPDLLATQELYPETRAVVDEVLDRHARVEDDFEGWGRGSNIWWRRDLFQLEAHGADDARALIDQNSQARGRKALRDDLVGDRERFSPDFRLAGVERLSLDLLLPVINLGHDSAWRPEGHVQWIAVLLVLGRREKRRAAEGAPAAGTEPGGRVGGE